MCAQYVGRTKMVTLGDYKRSRAMSHRGNVLVILTAALAMVFVTSLG